MESSRPDESAADPERPRTGRPLDMEKRQAIVAAAHKLFIANGLDAVSMDAIAARAGVSKATVYRHFTDKRALFDAVVAAQVDQFRYPPLDLSFGSQAEFRDFISNLGVMLIGFLSEPADDDLSRLLMVESRRHPQHAARFIERGPDAMHTWLAELLSYGTRAGYLDTPAPLVASDQLLSMWLGLHNLRHQFGVAPERQPEEVLAHVAGCVAMFFRAYAPSAEKA